MAIIIGLYVPDLYTTNYWIVWGYLYATNYWIVCAHFYATNYWIVCDGFVWH